MRTVIACTPADNTPMIFVRLFWSEEVAQKVADWLTAQGYHVLIV
jgi:hypothetical protein